MSAPRISVLMAVYNGAAYLPAAVDSVLGQTCGDFELIIVDDGSTDESTDILRRYAEVDPRVQLVVQENQGLTKSLNKALSMSQGEYVARMDADDICFPERFERQLAFLTDHPDIALVGTGYQAIDETGAARGMRTMFTDPHEIDQRHLDGNTSLAHPTIMGRRAVFEQVGGYAEEYRTSQDLDLFLRIAEVAPITNIDEPLLYYRWHDDNISVRKADQQDVDCTAIVAAAHRRRGLPVPIGVPRARWTFRRVMAHKYAITGNQRQALAFAWQAVRMRPANLRSWYTLLRVCAPSLSAKRQPV